MIFWLPVQPSFLLAIVGLVLLTINLAWMTLLLGVFCTRYRDVPQTIASLLQVSFYLTPVIWMPELLSKRVGTLLLNVNPFFHLIEIIRAPLLGALPTAINWIFCICLALAGWCLTIIFYGRFRGRIAYWL
jgi:lipopolysaccharide transport system permease protein